MGFNNPGPVIQNIGNGFIMDDFKMGELSYSVLTPGIEFSKHCNHNDCLFRPPILIIPLLLVFKWCLKA